MRVQNLFPNVFTLLCFCAKLGTEIQLSLSLVNVFLFSILLDFTVVFTQLSVVLGPFISTNVNCD